MNAVAVAPSPQTLARALADEALRLGFSKVGFAPAEPLLEDAARLEAFRAAGYAGSMRYLEHEPRHDPRALLANARSVVVVALSYADGDPERGPDGLIPPGQLARYARRADYHLVLKQKLEELAVRAAELAGRPVLSRVCVDTAPLLERALATRAGIGFVGKNGLVIAPGLGSYVLLGELLLDVDLEPTPGSAGGCGSCRACLDACPTQAFVSAHVLDARRCVSYLTIEFSGVVPRELRAGIGTRVFGCDACQDVCPFNTSPRERPPSAQLGSGPGRATLDLVALLELGSAGYRKLVRRTALRRVNRTTLQRNAAIALGNSGTAAAVAPLVAALSRHASALVRLHAAWGLGALARHLDVAARAALDRAARADADADVRAEAVRVLAELAIDSAALPR